VSFIPEAPRMGQCGSDSSTVKVLTGVTPEGRPIYQPASTHLASQSPRSVAASSPRAANSAEWTATNTGGCYHISVNTADGNRYTVMTTQCQPGNAPSVYGKVVAVKSAPPTLPPRPVLVQGTVTSEGCGSETRYEPAGPTAPPSPVPVLNLNQCSADGPEVVKVDVAVAASTYYCSAPQKPVRRDVKLVCADEQGVITAYEPPPLVGNERCYTAVDGENEDARAAVSPATEYSCASAAGWPTPVSEAGSSTVYEITATSSYLSGQTIIVARTPPAPTSAAPAKPPRRSLTSAAGTTPPPLPECTYYAGGTNPTLLRYEGPTSASYIGRPMPKSTESDSAGSSGMLSTVASAADTVDDLLSSTSGMEDIAGTFKVFRCGVDIANAYCKLKRDRKNMKSFGGMMAVAKDVGEIGVGAYGLQDQVF
jgi:hypothetical protein